MSRAVPRTSRAAERRARLTRILMPLVVLGLVVMGLVSAPRANAAAVDVVVPGSIKITNDSGQAAPLYENWDARIDLQWDTTGTDTKSGDTFTVDLPSEFDFRATSTFPLTVGGDSGDSAGDCVVTPAVEGGAPARMVCTFNDFVESYDNVKGDAWFRAQMVKTTENESTTFTVDSQPVVVPLGNPEGGTGIGTAPIEVPTTSKKEGYFIAKDYSMIGWFVTIVPGEANSVAFEDSWTPGQKFTADSLKVTHTPASKYDADPRTWPELPADQVQIAYGANGFSGTLTGLQSDEIYVISYGTTVDNPQDLAPGDSFGNEIALNGTKVSGGTRVEQSGGGSASGTGRGGLSVAKVVAGPAADKVPADTEFTVRARYELDGQAKSEVLSVTAGGQAAQLADLPKGTVVTLDEVAPSPVAGVEWGTPVFTVVANPNVEISDDGATATVTVQEDRVFRFTLTNTATPVEVTTPTPSQPTPSQPTPSQPTPSQPTPSEPTPSQPTPVGSCEPSPSQGPSQGPCISVTVTAPAPEPAGDTDVPTNPGGTLANTGSSTGLLPLVGGLALVAGGAALIGARRRR